MCAYHPPRVVLAESKCGTYKLKNSLVCIFLGSYEELFCIFFQTIHVHNTLALSICHEILRDATLCADLGHDQNYLRGLLQLNLSLESESFKSQVLTLLAKMKRVNNSRYTNLLTSR